MARSRFPCKKRPALISAPPFPRRAAASSYPLEVGAKTVTPNPRLQRTPLRAPLSLISSGGVVFLRFSWTLEFPAPYS
jgi:hypothetical protein